MTSRRSAPTWAVRKSRALHFRPGHVGGRVASAQPIRRNSGTLRREPVGGMAAAVTLRPVLLEGCIPNFAAGEGSSATLTLVGGAGDSTLRDQSDSTYARMTSESVGGGRNIYIGSVQATFDSPSLAWEPMQATLTCRVRALIDTYPPRPADPGAVHWDFLSPSGAMYARSSQFPPNTRWYPTASWADMPSDTWAGGGALDVPSAADVAAGVQVQICAYTWAFDPAYLQLDVSDMWLTLDPSI